VLCKCCRGGTGGSVGPCISFGSDNPGVSDGVLMAVEEQVSKKTISNNLKFKIKIKI